MNNINILKCNADEMKPSKGVNQSVKCYFRKEDFMKKVQPTNTTLESTNERFVEGINTKDGDMQQIIGENSFTI